MKNFFSFLILSLILTGCGSFTDRQDRAQKAIDGATDTVIQGVEKAKDLGKELQADVTNATEALHKVIEGTEEKVQQINDSAQKMQEGFEKMQDGLDQMKGGLDDAKGAVTGEEEEISN